MVYDLIIMGGGPAGYLAGERAGHAGMNVLLVEQRNVGGVCLNEGCIPTKTLLYSAKLHDGAKNGAKYGVTAQGLSIDHSKVLARKDKVVRTLVSGVKAALKASGVTVVNARGSITGKTEQGFTLEADGEAYTGKRLLIATGSSPIVPPIPGVKEGLESGQALTSREALSLKERPNCLAVIGGGVIGLELASYFNSLGCEVHVVEMLDHIAGDSDQELADLLKKGYEKRGVHFHLSARATALSKDGLSYETAQGLNTLPADKVLLAIGRKPFTEGIGLERIGVYTERGFIVTDDRMRTNIPGVYAAGDVNGQHMLAHTAYREAEVAVNDMLEKGDRMRYNAIPAVLYTNPELASVGETEQTARAKGYDVRVVKLPMRFSGRYLAENEGGDGLFKLIVDQKRGTLLGAQALANYASEFIVTVGAFIELGATLEQVQKVVFPHPTVAEIIREAAFAAPEVRAF